MKLIHIIPGLDSEAPQTLKDEHTRALESISSAASNYSSNPNDLRLVEICDHNWPASNVMGVEVFRGDIAFVSLKAFGGIRPKLRSFFPESLSNEADYIVFTNSDICVTPDFYVKIGELIGGGTLAGSIHRKTVLGLDPSQPASVGKAIQGSNWYLHPGSDCFFFPAASAPALRENDAVLGVSPVGRLVVLALAVINPSFKKFPELGTTFHFGDDRAWATSHPVRNLRRANFLSYLAAMPSLISRTGLSGYTRGMKEVGVSTWRDWLSLLVVSIRVFFRFPKT